MTRDLALVFAIAGGAAVGNLYWAQPLLEVIASDLDVPLRMSSWLVTVVQLGYAGGVLLIVPLGDHLTTEQRKDQRGDRVFIDYLRNAYGQNAIPPYGVRVLARRAPAQVGAQAPRR